MSHQAPRATFEVVIIAIVVFLVQIVGRQVGLGIELFALSAPFTEYPWTVVTSVYTHGGVAHLFVNLIAIVLFGVIVERRTTRWRFHAFVLTTGALAGITEVLVGSFFGAAPLVAGISGAALALMGYAMASNLVTERMVRWFDLSVRAQFVILLLCALAITWVTRGERVAMIAHFVGFVAGLVAGRLHLLRVS